MAKSRNGCGTGGYAEYSCALKQRSQLQSQKPSKLHCTHSRDHHIPLPDTESSSLVSGLRKNAAVT